MDENERGMEVGYEPERPAIEIHQTADEFPQENILDLIDYIKGITNDETLYYPIISYMCRNGFIKNWEVKNNVDFYVEGVHVA
jgi:hypothetical protein